MIQHPAVIALSSASILTSAQLLAAGWQGMNILRHWDLQSGSEQQLQLERRTYLISTLVGYALLFQILSLFLFIFTADRLHGLFVGAMCAAGTLNVNGFGYPALLLKLATCLLAGIWLVINHADTQGYDYPLIRVKYGLLLLLAPLVVLETGLQVAYFLRLQPDVITSCCGSLFSPARLGGGDLLSLPHRQVQVVFFGIMAATLLAGGRFWRRRRGAALFSGLSVVSFVVAAAALISFICLYIYELPTHHCPFCILQREYGYIGYLLYGALMVGGIAGGGCGVLLPFQGRRSLQRVIPQLQRRLAVCAMLGYLLFAAVAVYQMTMTSFRLD